MYDSGGMFSFVVAQINSLLQSVNTSISIYSIHYSVGNNYINSIAVITLSIWDRQDCANSTDPDQTPQNAASGQGLSCLPLIQ